MKRFAVLLLSILMLASFCGSAAAEAEPITAYTNCLANVRKGPSMREDILFELETGTGLSVLETLTEDGMQWCHIVVAGSSQEGYILRELLDFSGAQALEETAAQADAWRDARTKCGVNLRESPSLAGVKIGEIAALTDLLALSTDEEWTLVRIPATGEEGYVQTNLLDYAPEKTQEQLDAEQALMLAMLESQAVTTAEEKRYSDDTDLSRRIDSSYYYYLLGEGAAEQEQLFDDETLSQYHTLSQGETSDEVLALKERLRALGYYQEFVSLGREYSESTVEYVKRFQAANGLEETGIADATTQALLFSEEALGPQEKPISREPITVSGAHIVTHDQSSAIQVDFHNNTGAALSGFALKIIPYSAYGEVTGLAPTLAEQAARSYEKKITVSEGSAYSDSVRENYFIIEEGEYFSGALVTVSSYTTTAGVTVNIDSDCRSWVAAGTATLADAQSASYDGRITGAGTRTDVWDMGFSCEYVLPVYRRAYSVPEGLVVTEVEPSNYGAWAGLQPGDVLLLMNAVPLNSTTALEKAKEGVAYNDTFELIFWRDGLYYAATLQR